MWFIIWIEDSKYCKFYSTSLNHLQTKCRLYSSISIQRFSDDTIYNEKSKCCRHNGDWCYRVSNCRCRWLWRISEMRFEIYRDYLLFKVNNQIWQDNYLQLYFIYSDHKYRLRTLVILTIPLISLTGLWQFPIFYGMSLPHECAEVNNTRTFVRHMNENYTDCMMNSTYVSEFEDSD